MRGLWNAEFGKILLAAALGSVLTMGGYGCYTRNGGAENPVVIEKAADYNRKASVVADVNNPQLDFSQAAEAVVPGVVNIRSTAGRELARNGEGQQRDDSFDPFEEFFGRKFRDADPRSQPRSGSGSGVIISADGFIVTNNHVVEGASELEVFLSDRRSYKAKVIGTDPNTDLALVKINATGLQKLAFANSDNVKIGQWVMAVGYPLQLESTVTAGIVSAKGRSIGILQGAEGKNRLPIESFIQTDAAINPGNSGGALVNLNGDLVGINTAIASPTGTYAGYGFAVPSNLVSKVVEDLLKYGAVQQAVLGVVMQQVDSKLIEKESLKVTGGVYVDSLVTNGSAVGAGIRKGDVILKIDNAVIVNMNDIREQIARHRPGDVISVTVNRGGSEKAIRVPLKGLNGTANIVRREDNERNESTEAVTMGAEFANLSADEKKRANVEYGVKVSSLNPGKLRSIGVRPGFIIQKVNSTPVKSVQELQKALANAQDEVVIGGKYPNDSQKLYYGFEK